MYLINSHRIVYENGVAQEAVDKKDTLVTKPDQIKKYKVTEGAHCQKSLKRQKAERIEKRQVFDLPKVQMEVTEYQVQVERFAGCGKETRAEFPKGVNQAVQSIWNRSKGADDLLEPWATHSLEAQLGCV